MKAKNLNREGQVLLMTLLVLSVATTVVLSIIGRTTTDVAMSNQIAESSQSFAAAEAGIEQALKTGLNSGVQTLSPGTGITYQATVNNIGGASGNYQYPGIINPDQNATIWLVDHNANGSLIDVPTYKAPSVDVCWTGGSTIPAVTVDIFYKTLAGVHEVARGAYDPDSSRAGTNNFSTPTETTGGCGDGTTVYKETLTFASFNPSIDQNSVPLLALRVQPLYAPTSIVINSSQVLPLQGSRIDSTGTAGNGITRKIVAFQQYRMPSSIFDYVVYSEGDFAH